MKLLLEHGAIIDVPGVDYEFALSLNSKGEENKNEIRSLLNKPANKTPNHAAQAMSIDLTSGSKPSEDLAKLMNLIMQKSSEQQRLELVTLLSMNPDLLNQHHPMSLHEGANDFGLTPVMAAALYGSTHTLKALSSFIKPEEWPNYINATIKDKRNPYYDCSV